VRPALSIVIPSHNQPELLRTCLASVQRHAPTGTELLVIDDCSREAVVSEAARAFAGVRILRTSQRSGFCLCANLGVAASRNSIVQLLNDDTEVSPGWAEAALPHFANQDVAAVAPLVLWGPPGEGPPRIDSAGDRYYLGGIAGKRGHGQRLSPEYLKPGPVFGASASSAFFRRDILLKVGGFPEHFGAYFEDVDLSFRLHWAGYRVEYEPASRVWHRVSASYGRPGRRLLGQQACNEERVFWRNVPREMLPRALPMHLVVLLTKLGQRCRHGGLLAFVTGRLRLLGEILDLLRHRRLLRSWCSAPDFMHWNLESRFWG
jgi:GT2 family glycosyltransferase